MYKAYASWCAGKIDIQKIVSSTIIEPTAYATESVGDCYQFIAHGKLADLIKRTAAACARVFTEFCVTTFVWITQQISVAVENVTSCSIVLPCTRTEKPLPIPASIQGHGATTSLDLLNIEPSHLTVSVGGAIQKPSSQAQLPLPETVSIMLHAAINFLDLQNIEPKTLADCDPTQPAVVLVHGYLGSNSGWFSIYNQLNKAGVHNIFFINLGHPFHSIYECTDMLREKIRSIQAVFGRNESSEKVKIILIGHSMGGLVARQYRQAMASRDGVEVLSIATLGSPLNGTPVAKLGSWIAPAPQQMLPDSSFIEAQQTWRGEEDTTTYLHIGSSGDTVVPEEYALDGHEKHMTSVRIPHTGHLSLLMSKQAGAVIVDFVKGNLSRF